MIFPVPPSLVRMFMVGPNDRVIDIADFDLAEIMEDLNYGTDSPWIA